MRLDEQDGPFELGSLGSFPLSVPQRCPFFGSLDPRAGQFADDDRQLRSVELFADIVNEVDQILFVLGNRMLRIDAVIPANSYPPPS